LYKKSRNYPAALLEMTETGCQLTATLGIRIAGIKEKGGHHFE